MKVITAMATATLKAEFSTRRLSPALLAEAENVGAKRAATFLATRALLGEVMHALFDCSMLPDIVLQPSGKPAFADGALPFFNLAHSGDQLLVAVSEAGAIGCDLEMIRPRRGVSALAEAFFSADENHWITTQADPLTAFWQLWCQREALLKQQGLGIWSIANVTLHPQQHTFCTPEPNLQLCHAIIQQSVLALAVPVSVEAIQCWHFCLEERKLLNVLPPQWQRVQHIGS